MATSRIAVERSGVGRRRTDRVSGRRLDMPDIISAAHGDDNSGAHIREGVAISRFATRSTTRARRRRLAACLVGLVAMSAAATVHLSAQDRPAIVVLFVDDSSQTWIREITDGITEVVARRLDGAPNLYFEYLDAVRFSDARAMARQRASFREKYLARRVDLVVAVAPDAASFLEQARDDVWPGRPVLFTSYTAAVPDRVAALPQAAGLTFDWGFGDALRTFRTVIPGLTTMAVVGGSAQIERQRQARDLDEIRRQGLTALDLSGPSRAETLARVAHLPAHSAVMIAGGQTDGQGHLVPTGPLCQMMSTAANVPTLMVGSQFLGCGIVGGLLRDFHQIGAIIGERAIAGLAAPLHGNETVPFARIAALKFDARQLDRWHVDERLLPAGSVVEFREPNLWREYRNEVAIVVVALLIQSALILGLLSERRQRWRAEAESRKSLAIATQAARRAA